MHCLRITLQETDRPSRGKCQVPTLLFLLLFSHYSSKKGRGLSDVVEADGHGPGLAPK